MATSISIFHLLTNNYAYLVIGLFISILMLTMTVLRYILYLDNPNKIIATIMSEEIRFAKDAKNKDINIPIKMYLNPLRDSSNRDFIEEVYSTPFFLASFVNWSKESIAKEGVERQLLTKNAENQNNKYMQKKMIEVIVDNKNLSIYSKIKLLAILSMKMKLDITDTRGEEFVYFNFLMTLINHAVFTRNKLKDTGYKSNILFSHFSNNERFKKHVFSTPDERNLFKKTIIEIFKEEYEIRMARDEKIDKILK